MTITPVLWNDTFLNILKFWKKEREYLSSPRKHYKIIRLAWIRCSVVSRTWNLYLMCSFAEKFFMQMLNDFPVVWRTVQTCGVLWSGSVSWCGQERCVHNNWLMTCSYTFINNNYAIVFMVCSSRVLEVTTYFTIKWFSHTSQCFRFTLQMHFLL